MTKSNSYLLLLAFSALVHTGCGGDGMPLTDGGMDPSDNSVPLDAGGDPDAGGSANGVACGAPSECASGACVDGVCCDAACDGVCSACTAALTGAANGTCAPVIGNTDPDAECAESVCTTGLCDGAGACQVVSNGTPCRASAGECDVAETCSEGVCPTDTVQAEGVGCRAAAGVCDLAEVCDGASVACPDDALVDPSTSVPACGAYACSGTAECNTTCVTDADCALGYFCTPGASNTCVPGRLVFVTSTSHTGDLGGLAGADAICQARAQAAGRSGTFRAWLSDGTLSASQRIQHFAGVYYRLAPPGTLRVASNWNDLVNGLDGAAIATDEFGVSAGSGTFAWTGTHYYGATDTSNTRCSDWTTASSLQSGTIGWTSAGSSDWSESGSTSCNSERRLYCVETVPPG